MQFAFGAGVIWATPLTDYNGSSIVNPTPVQLGALQELSLDITFDTKELYGQFSFALALGRGKGKMAGKAKSAQINGAAMNSLVFGQTLTAGLTNDYFDVVGQAIPATPFTITIAPPATGVFAYDLGVRNANGVPLTRVAASPATGQYTVSNLGAYVFSTADAGNTVYISYQYTGTSTTAQKQTLKNPLMGAAPLFKADIFVPYAGKSLVFTVPQCASNKLSFATKQDDFTIPEFDFSGMADASGNALYWGTAE